MALDDPGPLCATAASAPTVATRLEGEEDAEDDDIEQSQLWRVTRELHYAVVNVGRKKKNDVLSSLLPQFFFHHLT